LEELSAVAGAWVAKLRELKEHDQAENYGQRLQRLLLKAADDYDNASDYPKGQEWTFAHLQKPSGD
jgi:hypothetical protein